MIEIIKLIKTENKAAKQKIFKTNYDVQSVTSHYD